MPRSDLPFGSEFSPAQVQLPVLLEFAKQHGGDWNAFEIAVRDRYFAGHKTNDYNKRKLANNTKLGLIAYGVIDREAKLTELGEKLFTLKNKEADLLAEFARHILKNRHGMTLTQCVLDMQAGAAEVTLVNIRKWLEERGIQVPRGNKHTSTMKLWLEKAGVFVGGYRVDEARLRELLGVATAEVEALARFTPEQKAYLKALANMQGPGPYPSNEIEKLATASFGQQFDEKGLPRTVLYPLEAAGYITIDKANRSKSRLITATAKLEKDVILPLLAQLEQQTDTDMRPLLRKPLADVLKELTAEDKHTRGLALEALAFKLMRLIDLTYVATRLRGTVTGGAEVDLIFESARLVYSRWQVQCKNTGRVSLDDVAKEVGLTHMLKSNVIVIVSTGEIGPEARKYANKVMTDSNLCIVMVNGKDVETIEKNPAAIVDVFHREARFAMKIKAIEI